MLRKMALIAPALLLSACTNSIEVYPARTAATASPWTILDSASPSPEPSSSVPPAISATGTLLPWRPSAAAVTYDPAVVPEGASVTLSITKFPYGNQVHLTATGLVPNRAYGAHLHVSPCGASPDDSGPHYQNHVDPVTPSVDPVYANPENEVWLDFNANAAGEAVATAEHGWQFDPSRPPRALVLHADHTHTGAGQAGKAGARVACLTLPPVS
jgi:superoxide dismutase, Cu-Zn family